VSRGRKVTVTVCVGSSCHIKGARNVIMRFNEMLKEQNLEDKVELKGSFCMERCGEGINWQIDDEPLTSSTEDDAIKSFIKKIIKPIKGEK
jgi:NADH:ubiquinone oxidoreductase subunit E